MSAPIFIDPVQDGAADPTVIRNEDTGEWWMFYTNRRAHLGGPGWGWICGSPIGIAISSDGVEWMYAGTVEGLDLPGDDGLNTHWAPEVIRAEGEYHMYLTYYAGAPDSFEGVYRTITHFTSPDLRTWTRQSVLPLQEPNVIDACVARLPSGAWRMWYKDEERGSSTWSAISPDLYDWKMEGIVIPGSPDAPPHEGPNVFTLGGHHWLITDEWRGLAVYRSADMERWERQGLILSEPGTDPMDRSFARHADVVVTGDQAALFYFTHPEWDEAAKPIPETGQERRTVIHVAKLWVEDGHLRADRDVAPFPLTEAA
ncbi:family 43 glycosylhydrolase [Pelagovum pacificum]|uniref:Glycosyl hydrolase n=1 Tax=Pelagovum pacificum TaxID=2588711 RepID=A0A5C5GCN4_9RHOB|nr:family 43 glycosylhydrolase [Pelagovum pacificum]QQA44455.1 family 43 glycosylhydrolase [Pelagovum pacificum]TNY32428.1 glycosyl hydrolase [Pelagovum pacificum]